MERVFGGRGERERENGEAGDDGKVAAEMP